MNRVFWEKPLGFSRLRFAFLCLVSLFSVSVVAAEPSPSIDEFLAKHWQRPLAPQGEPPLNLSEIETRLDPKNCGTCHRRHFADWRKSLHSRAMQAGLLGQLQDMPADDLSQHQACIRCHAPLHEQALDLQTYLNDPQEQGLEQHGIVCAACHVRNYQWFGPPARKPIDKNARLPHNGFKTHVAFQDSKFCAACHQFKDDEYALNGKLLENTYNEWQASRYAKKKKPVYCQDCHMPKRKHTWLGIHDKKTTRNGVKISVAPVKIQKNKVSTEFMLENTGVGHAFPTYVTPKVTMQVVQLDKAGKPITDSLQQHFIWREVMLDLSKELSDSRLLPDQVATLSYQQSKHPEATQVQFKVVVAPDEFYARFYAAILKNGTVKKGKKHIEQALAEATDSVYTLYEKTVTLP